VPVPVQSPGVGQLPAELMHLPLRQSPLVAQRQGGEAPAPQWCPAWGHEYGPVGWQVSTPEASQLALVVQLAGCPAVVQPAASDAVVPEHGPPNQHWKKDVTLEFGLQLLAPGQSLSLPQAVPAAGAHFSAAVQARDPPLVQPPLVWQVSTDVAPPHPVLLKQRLLAVVVQYALSTAEPARPVHIAGFVQLPLTLTHLPSVGQSASLAHAHMAEDEHVWPAIGQVAVAATAQVSTTPWQAAPLHVAVVVQFEPSVGPVPLQVALLPHWPLSTQVAPPGQSLSSLHMQRWVFLSQ
jgi:hypothetical protein